MRNMFASVFLGLLTLALCSAPSIMANQHGQASDELGHWSAPEEAAQRSNPIPESDESIQRGRTLYEKSCVLCHGPDGRGNGPAAAGLPVRPADLVQSGHHQAVEIAWKIANGRGPMPAWKETLSEKEIWDLTNFIKHLGGKHQHR